MRNCAPAHTHQVFEDVVVESRGFLLWGREKGVINNLSKKYKKKELVPRSSSNSNAKGESTQFQDCSSKPHKAAYS